MGQNLITGVFDIPGGVPSLCHRKNGSEMPKADLVSEAGLARFTRRVLGQFPASWTLAAEQEGITCTNQKYGGEAPPV
jgi:hypothetical protein